jgi:hypothetical protein
VNYVRQYYAKEQLRLELALGQERYRGQYWQAEPEWPELQRIEARRVAAIRELTVEMNELLAEICPGETGEPLRLTPFFNLDQPAPNLAFLDGPAREEMETAMLGLATAASLGSDHMMAAAEEILSEEEFLEYSRWNAPVAASLRNRLAGFDPDEGEFTAILQWQAAAGSDQEAGARAELERRLGSERLARLDRQIQPEVSTAVQDLRRVGLPLDQAAWLADIRSRASLDLQQLWSDPQTTDSQKQAQVGFLLAVFRMKLAAQLGPRAAGADLLP